MNGAGGRTAGAKAPGQAWLPLDWRNSKKELGRVANSEFGGLGMSLPSDMLKLQGLAWAERVHGFFSEDCLAAGWEAEMRERRGKWTRGGVTCSGRPHAGGDPGASRACLQPG